MCKLKINLDLLDEDEPEAYYSVLDITFNTNIRPSDFPAKDLKSESTSNNVEYDSKIAVEQSIAAASILLANILEEAETNFVDYKKFSDLEREISQQQ
ncbi:hypothetical protein [Parasitella parasitica]|uniref:Uncharacterized protein n=1 Tax=Parasitella parasitica TaxID=35722 RepID=A0A0B7NLX6_9FUNG|nr:hypothetical protein [Parasitella parasitica]